MIEALLRHREADQAPAMLGHEVDRLGRGMLSPKREVTLVLAVGVVNDDDHATATEFVKCLVDRYEGHIRILSGAVRRA